MAEVFARPERQRRLAETIHQHPFYTDEELARQFKVSVQTIRLDRMSLRIPELRERLREVAERTYSQVKSIAGREIVGDLLDIELGRSGLSVLETTPEMAFERTGVVRGHHIFAQADSLAIALIDADTVLTGLANVKFRRPVRVGEKLVAKAEVLRQKGNKFVVLTITRVGGDDVFRGKFVVFALETTDGEIRPRGPMQL